MNGYTQEKTFQLEAPTENVAPRLSLLSRWLAWRSARQFERRRQARNQQFAWRVQELIAARGLTSSDYSIGGGRAVHVPRVVSVSAGPPVGLEIQLLPGQVPDDFTAHASAIAYNLGVAEVLVVPLGPSRVRLDLMPRPR